MQWTEKYRPKTIDEVVGNEVAKRDFIQWVKKWKKGEVDEVGILLVGPPGIGKTSWVYAFANSFGYNIIETNASDYRSKAALEQRLGHISRSITLDSYFLGITKKEPLIFLDEVDGLDPKADKGAIETVINIAKNSGVLTVLAANIVDMKQHKELLNNFYVIEFKPLTPRQIELLLRRIIMQEGIDIGSDKIKEISIKCKGDARTAINMLQSIAIGISIDVLGATLENLPFDAFMKRLFEAKSYEEIVSLIQSNISHMEELIQILWDIVSRSGMDIKYIADFLNELSYIDTLWGRINRERKWGLTRYLFNLLPNYIYKLRRYVTYEERFPEYRFYLFVKNRKVREQRDEALSVLPRYFHVSKRKFITEILPFTYNLLLGDMWKDFREWCSRVF